MLLIIELPYFRILVVYAKALVDPRDQSVSDTRLDVSISITVLF